MYVLIKTTGTAMWRAVLLCKGESVVDLLVVQPVIYAKDGDGLDQERQQRDGEKESNNNKNNNNNEDLF